MKTEPDNHTPPVATVPTADEHRVILAMAHQAEAERDRPACVIATDGEFQASARLADAARVMGAPSRAMQLRCCRP